MTRRKAPTPGELKKGLDPSKAPVVIERLRLQLIDVHYYSFEPLPKHQ